MKFLYVPYKLRDQINIESSNSSFAKTVRSAPDDIHKVKSVAFVENACTHTNLRLSTSSFDIIIFWASSAVYFGSGDDHTDLSAK